MLKNSYKALYVILFLIGQIVSLLFTHKLLHILMEFFNIFYSGWTKRGFKKCKGRVRIEYPLELIGGKYIEIGKNFSSRGRLRMEVFDAFLTQKFTPALIIGDNVCFNYDCHVGCVNKIIVGNNVLIGSRVLITDHFHGEINHQALSMPPNLRPLISKGAVIIQDNVWIGEGAIIMPNVEIGTNSIIGANAVITKNVPANSVIGGVPGKIIKSI